MINVETKIHDNFSVEFKIGFVPQNKNEDNDFKINTWLFIPNSLDINPSNYGKDQFYRDVKSNIRLITPQFTLDNIVGKTSIPFIKLVKHTREYIVNPSLKNFTKFEYHIKMLGAICKSSARNLTYKITSSHNAKNICKWSKSYIDNAEDIITTYRSYKINQIFEDNEAYKPLVYADEYLSQTFEMYSFRIINKINDVLKHKDKYQKYDTEIVQSLIKLKKSFLDFLVKEKDYQSQHNFLFIKSANDKNNRNVVYRYSLLKKFIESDMYIKLHKKQDAFAIRQVLYGISAGMAMVFATVIAFSVKWKYGSVSLPLFIALVISYIFKDRIKEFMRVFFDIKITSKYYDDKAAINISKSKVGWVKEAVEFIKDKNTPKEVLKLRNRSSLLQYENEIFDEKIILYRKRVFLDGEKLSKHGAYKTTGINDIMRFHLNRFVQKTDNPVLNLQFINKDNEIDLAKAQKIYYINIIMQFIYNNQFEYKRFRIVFVRTGIIDVQDENNIN